MLGFPPRRLRMQGKKFASVRPVILLDDQRLKGQLQEIALTLGVARFGVTTADPFPDEQRVLEERAARGLRCPFEAGEPAQRCRPADLLPGARSIIAIAVPYWQPFPQPGGEDRAAVPAGWRGEVSRYAWGEDYHRVLHVILRRLAAYLDQAAPGGSHRLMTDTTPLVERAVARRAGLGWIGKNCCLITPRHGSWVFLGEIITTVEIPPDPPFPDAPACGDCDLCLRACPTGALAAPGVLDHRRCLAYLTQAGEPTPAHLRSAQGRRIWGCDTCQTVCPHNRGPRPAAGLFGPATLDEARPPLVPLLAMSKSRFRAVFGKTAAAWRGRLPLQRNALIALGNLRHPAAVPLLAAALAGPQPQLRQMAAWALGRVGNREAVEQLRQAMAAEIDPAVRAEIQEALKNSLNDPRRPDEIN